MKRLFVLFAIFGLALSMQLVAAKSIGPPGVAVVRFDSLALTPIAPSLSIDVAPAIRQPVQISAASAAVVSSVEPMLAGLMYGDRLNYSMTDTAAEAYLIPMTSGAPAFGLSA